MLLNYHHMHRIGFYLHHHNSISESIYFCYSLSYFGLCNKCNSSLTCWTTHIQYSVPIINKITSILPSYLTDTNNTQHISPHFLFNILQLPHRIHFRTFHVPTLLSCFSSILCLPSPYTFRFPFQPSAFPLGAYSAFERPDGFSSTASSALPEKDRIARMGTALCSSPGAVFGRVLFGLRVSPSSTISFFENFSAMFLGMVVGEVVSRCLPHNCLGSALC